MKSKFSVFCTSALVLALSAGAALAAIPSGDLLFSVNHNDLPESGVISTWGGLTAMDQPTVDVIDGVKWVNNEVRYAMIWDPAQSKDVPHDANWAFDGFQLPGAGAAEAEGWWPTGSYNDPIAIDGASIVLACRSLRPATVAEHSSPWTSIVDIFYDQLVLGVKNDTGQVVVRRNGSVDTAAAETALGDAESTILSLVMQANGDYKVWANGVEIMDVASNGAFSAFNPGGAGNEWFKHFINVGRNQPDGWTTFNGNIGDIYVYKNALSDADRLMLEAEVAASMGMAVVPEPGTIVAMLSGLVGLAGYGIRRRK